MRAKALVSIIVFSLLFVLLWTATKASNIPAESAFAAASIESWSNFQPTGWVTSTPVTCSVEVYNQGGFFIPALGQYQYRTGGDWSAPSSIPPEGIVTIDSQRRRLIVTNLPFPNSVTPDQNQIKFSILDNLGIALWSPPYSVLVDTVAPTSVVGISGCYVVSWSGEITGTASDAGSGVSRVEITLRNSAGWYYNGSSWQSMPVWLLTNGTNNWRYSVTLGQGTYIVRSRAMDLAGNSQAVPDEKTFTYDSTAPQSNVQITGCFNDDSTWPGAIYGSASDSVSGVASVQVAVQRASDGFYYHGGTEWGSSLRWLTASGTTVWSLPFTPRANTTYTVQSRAIDGCGNLQDMPARGTFTYDTTPPQSTVEITGCFNANSVWSGFIYGSASDAVSGVANVQITLRRASDGLYYYGGTSWGSAPRWITVSGTTNWSLPFTPPVDTSYTVQAKATDQCDNEQTEYGQGTFSYDVSLPQSEVRTAGYFNTWPGAITGTASDVGSGLANVQINLQRAWDGRYYDGSSWVPISNTWLTVSGATTWSFPFVPTLETTYTVKSRATDACGNVQSPYHQASFTYDVTAPSPPSNLSVSPSGWSKVNSFTLTWNNPPDVSGITRAHYKWNTEPNSNTDESAGSPASAPDIQSCSVAVPSQGTHLLYLWLEDAAGNANYLNRNATTPQAFKYDAVSPTTSVANVSGWSGCGGWYTSTVQVTLSAVDPNPNPSTINETSGISATFWRKDGGSWQRVVTSTFEVTGEGPHTIEYYSEDHAGNQEPPRLLTPAVKLDSVPPTTTVRSYTGTLGRNGWYTSTVRVALNPVDFTSGISATYYGVDGDAFQVGREFDVTTDGEHTIRFYSVDAACNQEAIQTTPSPLKIDKTHPTTSYTLDGLTCGSGWFSSSPVTITLTPSDVVTGVATSGIEKLLYQLDGGTWQQHSGAWSFSVAGEGAHTIRYYATDLAGNMEPMQMLTVGIDFHAPPVIPYTPIVSPSGWTKTNCFTITWEPNPPDLSGIGGVYYQFHEPVSSTDGVFVSGDDIKSIPCVQIPTEFGDGPRNVYIWLVDKACNSDHRTWRMATLRLDQTPPLVSPQVTGNLCAPAGWYNSCITVTFVATDNVPSGMVGGVISYQVNGGGWVTGASYSTCTDGRYTIEGRAMDAAGNVGNVATATLKLDRTAPPMPINLRVEPSGWSNTNSFTVHWLNPTDLSGVGGVYYKLGSLPTSPTDGVYVDGVQSSLTISATTEGDVPVYIWLVDKACNSDHRKAAEARLKYDRTPPTTTFSASGTLGGEDWYVSPVQITLRGEDNVSGWASSYYRVSNGPWQSGTSFTLASDGVISFTYYSVDVAGNVESTRTSSVKIDLAPPRSRAYADTYSRSTAFIIYWDGSDASSGIASFDVQYRVGTASSWQNWMTVDPSQTSALFTAGVRGKTYYFRTRAIDKAGNEESYPTVPDVYVVVDPLLNGDFEPEPDWGRWERSWMPWPLWQGGGTCQPTSVITQSYNGGSTHAVLLGCPGPRDGAPVGASVILQTIDVPTVQDMPAPMLYFRYRIFTYDVLRGPRTKRLFDSFNVGVCPLGELQATWIFTDSVFMDGNKTEQAGQWKDLGWHEGAIDLRPYAGRRMRVYLANATRWDSSYNTWTVVDDVRVINLEYKLYLPAALRVMPILGSLAAEVPSGSMAPESSAVEPACPVPPCEALSDEIER